MFCVREFVLLLLTLFDIGIVVKGEMVYKARFMESPESCEDFDNKIMDASQLVMASEGLSLGGKIEAIKSVSEGSKMSFEMYKETDHGLEYLGQLMGDLCESIKDENAPWWPVVEAMDLSGCPIPAKNFPIDEIKIDIGFANDFMNHEYCGPYVIKMILSDDSNPPEMTMCYQIQVAIVEEEE